MRDNWLNPPELIRRVAEVVPGYPDRILPKDDAAAVLLRERTLTDLYNERPYGSTSLTKSWIAPSPLLTAGPIGARKACLMT